MRKWKSAHVWNSPGAMLMTLVIEQENGCVEYTGPYNPGGYGVLSWGGKVFSAHRLAYEMHYGEIPEGLCVLHRCDNRRCINYQHLFVGTRTDNHKDMHAKGRGYAVLNGREVRQIRLILASRRFTSIEIAAWFGVSIGTIDAIKHGRTWVHVPNDLPWRKWHGDLPHMSWRHGNDL
jgi:hypothetical protein